MDALPYFGHLELATEPFQSALTAVSWQALWTERLLAAAAVLVLVICAKDIALIFPHTLDALLRFKPNRTIQHSWHLSRSRAVACIAMLLPFWIIAARYAMVPFGWWSQGAAMAAYLLLRRAACALLRSGKLAGEGWKAMVFSPLTGFVPLVMLMVFTTLLDAVFHIGADTVRVVLYAEAGLFFLLQVVHEGEFLHSVKSGLTTFLYLCALELVSAGAVASAILFI